MPSKRPKNIASVVLDDATAARIDMLEDMLDIMNEPSEGEQDSVSEAE